MLTIKVQCGCGQRYTFDVEPVDARMPNPVACPVCGMDGTGAANTLIAQTLGGQRAAAPIAVAVPAPAPAAAPLGTIKVGAPRPTTSAPMGVPAQLPGAAKKEKEWGPGGEGDTWKWWYYIVAGVCIAGYDIYMFVDTGRIKHLGGLFLAALCIAIGVWDFQRKRKKRRARG